MSDYVQAYLGRARGALADFAGWSQADVDRAVGAVAGAVFDNAEELARLAVDESGMGVYEDKVLKNRNKARMIAADLSTKKSVGIISRDAGSGIIEIAKPVGVVAAITPVTNPIVTPMSNAMFAIKGRNAIVITPHHHAVRSSTRAVELINERLAAVSAPDGLVQIIGEHSRENTRELISSADVVIATGGMGMVKAAYSSGRPALGVGAGNVQCILDRGVDVSEAVKMIVFGRAFDNGIVCTSEQSVIFPREIEGEVVEALARNRAFVLPAARSRSCPDAGGGVSSLAGGGSPASVGAGSSASTDAAAALRAVLFTGEGLDRRFVGRSALDIAAAARLDELGLFVPRDTLALAVFADGAGACDRLSGEKMCPVISLYAVDSFEEAVDVARANLEYEGKGHSVSIHSRDESHIEYAGLALPVSRIVVNQTSATNAGGGDYNGLAPTNTLGCGSWGNNSISENLTYKHLINITRVAERLPEARYADFVL